MIKNSLIVLLLLLVSSTSFALDYNIKRAQFTTAISNREPVDNVRQVETSYKTLVFFTEIVNCRSCDITHQWWFNGKMVHEQEGYAKYDRYRWWSKKRVDPKQPGTWTVVVTIDEEEVHKAKVMYFIPTKTQKSTTDIQKRIQIKSNNQCEEKLEYFHQQSKENPDDPYFKFMLNKWGNRCFESE